MQEEGYATAEEAAAVEAMGWEYVIPRRDRTGLGEVKGADMGTKYFVEAVRREVASRYGEDTLSGGGLRLYTPLDFAMQAAAWHAAGSTLHPPADPAAAEVAGSEEPGKGELTGKKETGR